MPVLEHFTSQILNLLLNLIFNSLYSRKFRLQVKCLFDLFRAHKYVRNNIQPFIQLFVSSLLEKIPKLEETAASFLANQLFYKSDYNEFFEELHEFMIQNNCCYSSASYSLEKNDF